MSNSFSLDDIRKAAEAKYGSTDIELPDGKVCSLVNPLRLSKEKRAELVSMQDKMDESGADQFDILADAIRLVATSKSKAEALIEAADGDLTILVEVFSNYTSSTQVGEASASQS